MTLDDAMAELATLVDPRMREVNPRHGDDHRVNLTGLPRTGLTARSGARTRSRTGRRADTGHVEGHRSSLQLRPAVLSTSSGDLHHLDLVVDGASIQTLMGREGATILTRVWLPAGSSPVDVFRGRALDDLAGPGRVSLLTCSICADLGCGVLTATIQIGPDEVAWSDFRWVTGYDDEVVLDELPSPMRFDRGAYERELDRAEVMLPSLPSEVRRPPRRRWWRR